MFGSVIISALITFVLTVMAWVSVAIYRRNKPKLPYFIFFGCLVTLALFIPGCLAINWGVCAVAYGNVHYATAAEMKTGLPLPAGAHDITRCRADVTQCYRFKISEDELRRWLTDYISKFRGRPAFSGGAEDPPDRWRESSDAEIHFKVVTALFFHTGWTLPNDIHSIGSATFAANGAGIHVWYSEKEGAAYCLTSSR